jgi:hypothetical protein
VTEMKRVILLAATSLVAFSANAQDPLTPFLGTWSGVFTTQDNEYWNIEDFLCFPGCAADAYHGLRELLDDPANDDQPVDVLSAQVNAAAAEHLQSIMTDLGRRIQQENAFDNDPKLHCQPYGLVRQVMNPLPMVISRDGEHLLFRYEEWSLLRTVYMDGRTHPQYRTPSLLGHSVGRIEDGVLIIETARVTPDRISDGSQAGYSVELTAVERYTIRENPRRLELELTIEDPVTLTEPYRMVKTWLATPGVDLVEDSCGALPGKP